MKRITEPSTIVDDLMPGTEYVFRVLAGNQIGSSEPSEESDPFQMPRSPLDTEFSLDPFESHYDLLGEIGRCVHTQNYVWLVVTKYCVSPICVEREREMCTCVCISKLKLSCFFLRAEAAMVQCMSVCTAPLNRRMLLSSSH